MKTIKVMGSIGMVISTIFLLSLGHISGFISWLLGIASIFYLMIYSIVGFVIAKGNKSG